MSKNQRPKTCGQVRAIFGLAKERGLDHDELYELVASVLAGTRGNGAKSLSADRTDKISPLPRPSIAKLTYAEAERVIARLKGNSFVPPRTLQYRRAKAGVKQMVQPSQLELIAELASQRGWPAETLRQFSLRQCKRVKPLTTDEANKVIEALKAMNAREGLWAA